MRDAESDEAVPMGRFLRDLLHEAEPAEPAPGPDDELDLLERLLSEPAALQADAVDLPLPCAGSVPSAPGQTAAALPSPRPDYYTLSVPDWPASTVNSPPAVGCSSPPESGTQRKRRYQRRGAIKLRHWAAPGVRHGVSKSAEEFAGLDREHGQDSDDVSRCRRLDLSTPIRSQTGVTRKLSMRQKAAQPVETLEDHCSLSGDESTQSGHKQLKETRSGSLPSMSLHSLDGPLSPTWSSNSPDKLSGELFPDPMTSSAIFRPDSGNNSVTDFQVLQIASEFDHNHLEVPLSPGPEDLAPHSAPPLMEDVLQFSFERRRSVLQELPAINEDQREDQEVRWSVAKRPPRLQRPQSQASGSENEAAIHRRSTSDYVLDKNEESPKLAKRNSVQETKGKPRMRIIGGNPNSADESDGAEPAHPDKNMMVLRQDEVNKKFHLVEGHKSSPTNWPLHLLHVGRMQKQKSQVSLTGLLGRFSRQNSDDSISSRGSHGPNSNASFRRSLKWKSLFGKEKNHQRDRSNTSISSAVSCVAALSPVNSPRSVRLRRTSSTDCRELGHEVKCMVSQLGPLLEDAAGVGQHGAAWNLPRSRHSCAIIHTHRAAEAAERQRRFSVVAPEEYYDKQLYRINDADNEKLNLALSRMDLSDSTFDTASDALNHTTRSISIDLDFQQEHCASPRSPSVNYLTLRKRRAWASPTNKTDLTSPRRTLQRKKFKAKRRPSSRAVDFIEPSLLHGTGQSQALLPLLINDPNLKHSLSATAVVGSRGDRDKKPGIILSSLLSIRHKKRKDGRSPASVSPSGIELESKRFSVVEPVPLNGALPQRKNSEVSVLPDSLARVFGNQAAYTEWKSDADNDSTVRWPLWEKPKWEDLDIWTDPEATWTDVHPNVKLEAKEEKRQNVIFEFYATEKRHCRVLIYLQQVYQAGLLKHNILGPVEVKMIIPDVLDSLLDFHLHLLRRIQLRIQQTAVVQTISDIVVEEFKNGAHRAAALNAYTDFCLAQDESDKCYNEFLAKNTAFRQFIDHIHKTPMFKKNLNFKSCFLLITQRFTKYAMLIDQMMKYETGDLKLLSQKAHHAVRSFASKVDREMSCHMLNSRFDQARGMIDRTSVGDLLGQKFTYDDLVLTGEEYRKILSIGSVSLRSHHRQPVDLCMLLFDDIIVFLQNRNGSFYFYPQKDHASVLPLHATLVRELPRSNHEVMLVVVDPKKPDMYQVAFNSKNELTQWVHALKAAHINAPKFVRMAKGVLFVEGSTRSHTQSTELVGHESGYVEELDKWHDELEKLYEEQKLEENSLWQYMEKRMEFLDKVRRHLAKLPARPNVESNGSVRQKEAKEVIKVKNTIKAHFADLRAYRRAGLDKLVEVAQQSRDSDLPGYFDEFHEISHPNEIDSATFSSSSDENTPSTSASCRKPRRVRTYHGAEDSKQPAEVRRHTTVPHVNDGQEGTSFEKLVDVELRKLPLSVSCKSRRATTELIREHVRLRIENDRLRDENALQKVQISALKARKQPYGETTEKLESLRQKQEEVQNREVSFKRDYEKRMEALKQLEDELNSRERELKEREMNLLLSANNNTPIGPAPFTDSNLNRDTSFRLGAAILDSQKVSVIPRATQSASDVVPRHLASKSETKSDKGRRRK